MQQLHGVGNASNKVCYCAGVSKAAAFPQPGHSQQPAQSPLGQGQSAVGEERQGAGREGAAANRGQVCESVDNFVTST